MTFQTRQTDDDDGMFVSLYTSFTHTYGTAQAEELQQWWHNYFSLVILAMSEVVLHSCWTNLVCLFYAIATVFQLYYGSYMMYEMRRGKPRPTLLPTQGIYKLPHHTSMV